MRTIDPAGGHFRPLPPENLETNFVPSFLQLSGRNPQKLYRRRPWIGFCGSSFTPEAPDNVYKSEDLQDKTRKVHTCRYLDIQLELTQMNRMALKEATHKFAREVLQTGQPRTGQAPWIPEEVINKPGLPGHAMKKGLRTGLPHHIHPGLLRRPGAPTPWGCTSYPGGTGLGFSADFAVGLGVACFPAFFRFHGAHGFSVDRKHHQNHSAECQRRLSSSAVGASPSPITARTCSARGLRTFQRSGHQRPRSLARPDGDHWVHQRPESGLGLQRHHLHPQPGLSAPSTPVHGPGRGRYLHRAPSTCPGSSKGQTPEQTWSTGLESGRDLL